MPHKSDKKDISWNNVLSKCVLVVSFLLRVCNNFVCTVFLRTARLIDSRRTYIYTNLKLHLQKVKVIFSPLTHTHCKLLQYSWCKVTLTSFQMRTKEVKLEVKQSLQCL